MTSVDKQVFIDGLGEYALTEEFKKLYDEVFHGPFKIGKIGQLVALVIEAVKVVERVADDMGEIGAGSGKAKKDAVVGWIDGVLDLPFFLEPIDGPIIGAVVDGICLFFNSRLTKNWISVVKKFL